MSDEVVHGIVCEVGCDVVKGMDPVELIPRGSHHEGVPGARAVLRDRQPTQGIACVINIARSEILHLCYIHIPVNAAWFGK